MKAKTGSVRATVVHIYILAEEEGVLATGLPSLLQFDLTFLMQSLR